MKRAIVVAGLGALMAGGGYAAERTESPLPPTPSVATPRVVRAAELAHPWGLQVQPDPTGAVVTREPLPVVRREPPPMLRGIVAHGARRLALWETAAGTSVTAVGETVGAWTVADMTDTQVTVVCGGEVMTVPLTEES